MKKVVNSKTHRLHELELFPFLHLLQAKKHYQFTESWSTVGTELRRQTILFKAGFEKYFKGGYFKKL